MYAIRGILALAGRLLIVAIFALSAANDVTHFDETVAQMKLHRVPYPEWMLPGAIIFLIVGSISVFVGFKARFGALLLLIFLGLASYFFHNFWDMTDPAQRQMQMIEFLKNLSMAGAMVFVIAVGAGPFSFDAHSTDTTG